ncbi:MAG: hypothetical protein IMZ46_16470, partial [Acidobacteria bacterium]|nr:hypothetical protein [Acidobacteriota bacterium]
LEGEAASGYEVHVTRSENTIKELARDLAGDFGAPPTLILLSGDGGISDLLNARDPDAPPPSVAILPLGTGNALFHSLHKPLYTPDGPTPLVHALRTLWRGTPSPLPAFSARFPPGSTLVRAGQAPDAWLDVEGMLGAVVFSHGFHASLVWESDTPRYRAHGAARFGMVAAELLAKSHAYEVEISVRGPGEDDLRPLRSVDGEREGEVGYVLMAMVSNMERTFTISPGSRPLDGRMRVVHFGAVGGRRTMEIMRAAYDDGKHVGMADVGYEEVEALEVSVLGENARWRKVCVDGTIVDVPAGGRVCLEGAGTPVNVLVQ